MYNVTEDFFLNKCHYFDLFNKIKYKNNHEKEHQISILEGSCDTED